MSSKVDYIKVLARGVLDKPLIIEAQDYSIDAIKMIVLTGGEVRKVK
ncbi:MAG: uL15 family ribosomal protein [Anaeroplasmataceae bacterium]|nr:uL15 family ribosomal protein [Anaeroplasmataceae bacterium]